jgi:sphingomyelin phosphodiesterase
VNLVLAAMQAIGPLTGTEETGLDFSIFTGDLTSHDTDNQYSRFVFSDLLLHDKLMLPARAYVEYAEVCLVNFLLELNAPHNSC